jgi:hypothetical protein
MNEVAAANAPAVEMFMTPSSGRPIAEGMMKADERAR